MWNSRDGQRRDVEEEVELSGQRPVRTRTRRLCNRSAPWVKAVPGYTRSFPLLQAAARSREVIYEREKNGLPAHGSWIRSVVIGLVVVDSHFIWQTPASDVVDQVVRNTVKGWVYVISNLAMPGLALPRLLSVPPLLASLAPRKCWGGLGLIGDHHEICSLVPLGA